MYVCMYVCMYVHVYEQHKLAVVHFKMSFKRFLAA